MPTCKVGRHGSSSSATLHTMLLRNPITRCLQKTSQHGTIVIIIINSSSSRCLAAIPESNSSRYTRRSSSRTAAVLPARQYRAWLGHIMPLDDCQTIRLGCKCQASHSNPIGGSSHTAGSWAAGNVEQYSHVAWAETLMMPCLRGSAAARMHKPDGSHGM